MLRPTSRRRRKEGPTARELQKQESQRRLLDAARRLFTERGFEEVTTRDLGAEAGVSGALIALYFGSKAGLLYALISENNAGQLEAGKAAAAKARTALSKIDRTLTAWVEMDLRHPRLLAAMQAITWTWDAEAEAANRADLRPFLDHLAELIRLGQQKGEIRTMPVESAVDVIWAVYTQGLRAGVFDGMAPDAVAAAISARLRAVLAA